MAKDLRKLTKTELLQIIYEQEKQIETLNNKINDLNKKLEDKTIEIQNAGSIAEASLKINKIFEQAQKVADEYVENVKKMNNQNIQPKKIQKKDFKNKATTTSKNKKSSPKINLALIPYKSNLPYFKNSIITNIANFFIKLFSKLNFKKLIKNINNYFTKIKPKILKLKTNLLQNFKKLKPNKNTNIDLKKVDLSTKKIKKEIEHQKVKETKINFAKTFTYLCIIAIAFAIIISTRIFNVLQVNGDSMEPTLHSENLLISYRFSKIKKGDIIAFYYDDKILIKRVIATGGDNIYIDDHGNVFVNSEKQNENYVKNLNYGKCDVTFPIHVPDNEYFVLGDNRETSIDSRNKNIGTVSKDKILGKILIKINI